jgi:hypothetical protein
MSIGHNGSSGNKGYYVPLIYVLNPKPLYSNGNFFLREKNGQVINITSQSGIFLAEVAVLVDAAL